MLTPKKVIIHHSATQDTGTLSWDAIRRYHVEHNGWSDIGYHAGIEQVQGHPVCLFGRPDVLPGAHTIGENGRSLGFVFVGDYDVVEPSHVILRTAARRVLAPWLLRFGLRPDHVVPHSDFAYKTCPGSRFDMDKLRYFIRLEMEAYG